MGGRGFELWQHESEAQVLVTSHDIATALGKGYIHQVPEKKKSDRPQDVTEAGCGLHAEVHILIHASCEHKMSYLLFSLLSCVICYFQYHAGQRHAFAIMYSVILCVLISRFYIFISDFFFQSTFVAKQESSKPS